MGRRFLAALIGAVVFFVWGMVWWMGLPFAMETMHHVKNEEAVRSALTANLDESGLYLVPFVDAASDDDELRAEFERRHAEGPLVQIYYRRAGAPLMDASVMMKGFAVDFVAALFAVWLISLCGAASFPQRASVVFVAGLFAAAAVELPQWIWWNHTADVHLTNSVYIVVGWLLAGLAIAAVYRPAATS